MIEDEDLARLFRESVDDLTAGATAPGASAPAAVVAKVLRGQKQRKLALRAGGGFAVAAAAATTALAASLNGVAPGSAAGTLCVAAAAGLSRSRDAIIGTRLVPALIGAAGLGLLGSAVFPTDPVGGYPPGTPDVMSGPSASMTRHGIAAMPIFFGLPAAAIACAWRFHRAGHPRWAFYSAATAASTVVHLGLAGAGFNQAPRLANRAGLFQRASIITAFAWITAVSGRAIATGSCGPS